MLKMRYKKIKKPWGGYIVLQKHPAYWLKKLFVSKGESLSLQSHKGRSEIWVVLSGNVAVIKGNSHFRLGAGEFLKINKKEKHRITGLRDAQILEVAFGKARERDIIRYADKYGRTT